MKFIIEREALAQLTGRIQNIVALKTPIPVLSNFLIEAKDNRIIVTATDLTVGVQVQHPAKVFEEGSTTIPARRFSSLIRELTSSHVEITIDEMNVAHIVADSSKFRVPGLPVKDFPSLPDMTGAHQVRMKCSTLKEMLFRTAFAVARDDSRYILTGLSLEIANGRALFTGTDGKRLAKAQAPVEAEPDFSYACVIPLKAIDEILKGTSRDEDDADLFLMGDKIAIMAGDSMVITKLLAGDYPDVDKVIPKDKAESVVLHKEELMSLLRQMSLFIPDTSHSIRFSFASGELNLSVNTQDLGEGKVSMPVNYAGERFDIAFNPTFFLDILRHSKEETVRFAFSDPYNPGIVTDGEKENAVEKELQQLFVIMPMRLNEVAS